MVTTANQDSVIRFSLTRQELEAGLTFTQAMNQRLSALPEGTPIPSGALSQLMNATPVNGRNGEFDLAVRGEVLQSILELPDDVLTVLRPVLRSKHSRVEIDGVTLEPKEFNAYVRETPINDGIRVPLSDWQRDTMVRFNAQRFDTTSTDVNLDNITFHTETPNGYNRIVGRGIITSPIQGEYGSFAIDGAAIEAGDGMELDYYMSVEARSQISAGDFNGRVVIFDQDVRTPNADPNDREPKFGFMSSIEGETAQDQMRRIMGSTWDNPEAFTAYLANGDMYDISAAQFRAYTLDLKENPAHGRLLFGEWLQQEWGSMEHFNAAFEHPVAQQLLQDGLTIEELEQIRTIGADIAASDGAAIITRAHAQSTAQSR